MNWKESYPKTTPPTPEEIQGFIKSPLWEELRRLLEEEWGIPPKVEHSICSMAPGWNVKYRAKGRALCTLYPGDGFFTALVSIGQREAPLAELAITGCSDYTQKLYWNTGVFQGGRWLMVEVTGPEILADLKTLLAIRLGRG